MNEDNKAPVKLGITSRLTVDHEIAQNTPENVMPNKVCGIKRIIPHRPARVPRYYLNLTRRIDEIEARINRIGRCNYGEGIHSEGKTVDRVSRR